MIIIHIIWGIVKGTFFGSIVLLVLSAILLLPVALGAIKEETTLLILSVVFFPTVIGVAISHIKEHTHRRPRHQSKRQRAAQLAKDERAYLARLVEESNAIWSTLKSNALEANEHLNAAQIDFAENAYSPFWDNIEKAAISLGSFQQGIRAIEHKAKTYKQVASSSNSRMPGFELAQGALPDARIIAQRMNTLTRQAQRIWEYASIYEQRRTQQIIGSAFRNLESAIYGMQDSIEMSFGDLSDSIGTNLDNMLYKLKHE